MSSQRNAAESIQILIDRAQAAYGRFSASHELRHLDHAIQAWDILLGHPALPGLPLLSYFQVLSDGGHLHLLRYLATRQPQDLELARHFWESALDPLERAIDDGAADPAQLCVLLASIAGTLEERYARGRSADDLLAALNMLTRAVRESAPESPYLAGYRAGLAKLLFERYQLQPGRETLDDAIVAGEQAVDSTSEGSPDLPDRLDQLAAALGERYVRFGGVEDLDRAIGLYDVAVARIPNDAADRARILNNFGRLLHQRFVSNGSLDDSQRNIDVLNEALSLVPAGTPFRTKLLQSLNTALDARHVITGSDIDPPDVDLPDDIREFLLSMSLDHPELNLDRAAESARHAARQTAHDSPEWPWRLSGLAQILLMRHLKTREPEDLNEAIAALEAAMNQWTLHSPHAPRVLSTYALALGMRFQLTCEADDLRAMIRTYGIAMAKAAETSPAQAITIGISWGTQARRRQAWAEATWAFGEALKAMTRLYQAQLQRHDKEQWLLLAHGVAAEAAYARTQQQEHAAAVEALEVGRALLLSEAIALDRARLDGLAEVGRADLKARYESAAERWNRLSAAFTADAP